MKEKERDNSIDSVIDRFAMTEKCGLTREEIRNRVEKGMVYNNLLYILVDTCNSFLMDMEDVLKPLGVGMDNKEKASFDKMYCRVKDACRATERFAKPLYGLKDADDACADSDWWHNFILLVDDRLGDDRQKTNMTLEYLINMPSSVGLFDIKYDDFKHFKV